MCDKLTPRTFDAFLLWALCMGTQPAIHFRNKEEVCRNKSRSQNFGKDIFAQNGSSAFDSFQEPQKQVGETMQKTGANICKRSTSDKSTKRSLEQAPRGHCGSGLIRSKNKVHLSLRSSRPEARAAIVQWRTFVFAPSILLSRFGEESKHSSSPFLPGRVQQGT